MNLGTYLQVLEWLNLGTDLQLLEWLNLGTYLQLLECLNLGIYLMISKHVVARDNPAGALPSGNKNTSQDFGGVRTCILDVWTCMLGVWACILGVYNPTIPCA